jgi:bifunctional N-acetylglucosamine-1-phosphate-uridyltransferase/glucosamine-1-phosphate-acetyltransferase GlmU-like protein
MHYPRYIKKIRRCQCGACNILSLAEVDVVVLCGGLSTRLRSALPSNTPKALALIDGKPFIEILLRYLISQGFRRFIMALGDGHEHIKERYTSSTLFNYFGTEEIELVWDYSHVLLGTGGSVLHARPQIESETLVVVNGDTLCELPYRNVVDLHLESGKAFTVCRGRDQQANGTYVIRKSALWNQPIEAFDLDDALRNEDVNRLFYDIPYQDIGTPERLQRFRRPARYDY